MNGQNRSDRLDWAMAECVIMFLTTGVYPGLPFPASYFSCALHVNPFLQDELQSSIKMSALCPNLRFSALQAQ